MGYLSVRSRPSPKFASPAWPLSSQAVRTPPSAASNTSCTNSEVNSPFFRRDAALFGLQVKQFGTRLIRAKLGLHGAR
jgi:hypothetical protein